jgi:hypothetical protein
MRILVLTATYELRVSRKSHLREHPSWLCPRGGLRRCPPEAEMAQEINADDGKLHVCQQKNPEREFMNVISSLVFWAKTRVFCQKVVQEFHLR